MKVIFHNKLLWHIFSLVIYVLDKTVNMKKFVFALGLFFVAFTATSQDTNGVINALKSANAEQVAEYFDKILDLKFPEKDETKSIGKNQAGIALKTFFENNKIKGFELASQREMGGTMYIAGKLINGAEEYKLTIMLKNKDGKPQIITIRIN